MAISPLTALQLRLFGPKTTDQSFREMLLHLLQRNATAAVWRIHRFVLHRRLEKSFQACIAVPVAASELDYLICLVLCGAAEAVVQICRLEFRRRPGRLAVTGVIDRHLDDGRSVL